MKIEAFSDKDTFDAAYEMGKKASPNDVFCVTGELGTGKTVFSKGLAKGLEIDEHITSPTFTIVNEYKKGRLPFYHFDVYRLEESEEFCELGLDEYFYSEGVCVVEWADVIKDFIPKNAVWINIKKDIKKGNDYRIIEVFR